MRNKEENEKVNLKDLMNPSWLPILTLDKKWHDLFNFYEKSKQINILEEKVNELLKEQGSINNEKKEISILKKKLMNHIILLTTEVFEKENESAKEKMENAQQEIMRINERLQNIEDRLLDIPYQLKENNFLLFEETTNLVYSNLKTDQQELSDLNNQMEEMRKLIKEIISRKVNLDQKIKMSYSYFHDLLGADKTELLDKKLL